MAKSLGMKAFGFSEHGNIFEWYFKKLAIESAGMKYIHACEVYVTENSEEKIRDNYHCVLIAKNYDGVKELNEFVSKAFNRNDIHYYYVPRITYSELKSLSKNIIITTACLGGILFSGNEALKKDFINFCINNKDRCFLEIQHHLDVEQVEYNKELYKLSQQYGIKLIAGTDTHSLNETHAKGRSMLQKSKGIYFENEIAWDLTFKSYDELVEAYEKQKSLPRKAYLSAIENTNVMADMVEEFECDTMPKYPRLYENSEAYIRKEVENGIKKRGIDKYENFDIYKERIEYELDVYKHNDAIDYMLLDFDYKKAMREKGIYYGPSRGSVSGSIVAYLLEITDIDSIKHKLNFERFMNKERVSLADIDTDFYSEDRDAIKEYLYNKKGLYCCDIVTFNTIQLRGAIRDIARGLEIPLSEVGVICKEAESNKDKVREKYPELFEYVDIVSGVITSVGIHPAGVVVSPFPVEGFFGTFTTSTSEYPISQIYMKEIEKLNFVKLDLLALDNVGAINIACKMAGIERVTPNNIPPDDLNVWESIRNDTTCIFQWESPSASAYLRKLLSKETIEKIKKKNPNLTYMDLLSMGNGAIRPVGESFRDELSEGLFKDNGHEALNDFLSPTMGFCIYQEQIMEFLHKFCGYTMGQADVVRRGFAKKTGTEEFIPDIKEGFIRTMQSKYNTEPSVSEEIIAYFLKVIEDAAGYGFSLNHSDPYSWIGYMCGYLRYYYPLEFLTASLEVFREDEKKTIAISEYVQSINIPIESIKYGKSQASYSCNKNPDVIYKGIASIKHLNKNIADELYEVSKEHFEYFSDLLTQIKKKTSVKSNQLDILIKLDFFSDFGNITELALIRDVFDTFGQGNVGSIKKDKVSSPVIEEIILKYGTDKGVKGNILKSYKINDMQGLLQEIERFIKSQNHPDISVKTKIANQQDLLGYIDIKTNKEEDRRKLVILNVRPLKSKKTNAIWAYSVTAKSIGSGKTSDYTIYPRLYNCCPVDNLDVIYIDTNGYTKNDKGYFVLLKYTKLY